MPLDNGAAVKDSFGQHLTIKGVTYPDSAGHYHRRLPRYNHLDFKVHFRSPTGEPTGDPFLFGETRAHVMVKYPVDTPKGWFADIQARYVTAREQAGPWSEVLEALVN